MYLGIYVLIMQLSGMVFQADSPRNTFLYIVITNVVFNLFIIYLN